MPHVTTHYRVIVTAGHHRQPRNPGPKWIEPYAPSNVEAVPGTTMNPFAQPQLSYVEDGQTVTANFLFWSAGDGVDGQSSTDTSFSTVVGDAPLTLVAWYLPPGGGNGPSGYIIDAFSDAMCDFVDDTFVQVAPDAALTSDANVVGWVPTAHAETLTAVPGTLHTGETFEHWIGGHPTMTADNLLKNESGYAIATYHANHISVPKTGVNAQEAWLILWGIINDAPGFQIPRGGGGGGGPVGPWGPYLARVARAAAVASLGAQMHGAAEFTRLSLHEVNQATQHLNEEAERSAEA